MTENTSPPIDTPQTNPAPSGQTPIPVEEGDALPAGDQSAIQVAMQAAEAAVSDAVRGMAMNRSPS